MLIDDVTVKLKAGDGGNGAVSFKRNAQTAKGGPDGGNGGNGGDLYLLGTSDTTVLTEFSYKKHILAENGIKGSKKNLYGRNGKDTTILVPLGTQVTDLKTNESFEVTNSTEKILIAKGGKGGKGNNEFKSAINQTPKYAEKGELGEEKRIRFELKFIADIGLIGLPNAGKSSLLEVLTNAHPKIANYPFTTLEANLGVLNTLVIADIPGLIEGASQGKGLGDKFLKHVEKTKILLHCIDSESINPLNDYETIRGELGNYNPILLEKQELIVITKADLSNPKDLEKKFSKIEKEHVFVSIYEEKSLEILKDKILNVSNSI